MASPPSGSAGEDATRERLIVAADLHMSTGAGAELFQADAQFARFAEHVATREPPVSRLVLAGDLFDLLHTTKGERAWRDTSEGASREKLELVARAHPIVMRALADLAGSGVRLDVIPGNHDLELVRPSAQRLLREVLGSYSSSAENSIRFHPWIFHLSRLVYIEHGSQHHDLNAITALLAPSPERLEIPLGAELEFHRLDRAAGARAEAYGQLGAALARRLYSLGKRRPRTSYRESVVRPFARHLGLQPETAVGLDGLAALDPLATERRIARKAVTRLIRRPTSTLLPGGDYLEEAAVRIDDLLEREGTAVPFYVFGHAHIPIDRPLHRGRPSPRYLNPGTWSRILPSSLRQAGSRARFGFIEIENVNGGDPCARLWRWDDASRTPERV
jgi:UDP-2,3-diacylglucosamine pyrophosphatase LpxH